MNNPKRASLVFAGFLAALTAVMVVMFFNAKSCSYVAFVSLDDRRVISVKPWWGVDDRPATADNVVAIEISTTLGGLLTRGGRRPMLPVTLIPTFKLCRVDDSGLRVTATTYDLDKLEPPTGDPSVDGDRPRGFLQRIQAARVDTLRPIDEIQAILEVVAVHVENDREGPLGQTRDVVAAALRSPDRTARWGVPAYVLAVVAGALVGWIAYVLDRRVR